MASITLKQDKIEKHKGVVILPLKEYQMLLERAVPTYYLSGKAAKDADRLVEEGLREYRSGKTIEANSLKDALRKYGKNRKH